MSNRIVKGAAGLAALLVIGVGAALIGGASPGDASGNRNAPAGGFGPPGIQGAGPPGGARAGGPPGPGIQATGRGAAQAKAAALEKYPGTVEAVVRTPDGGYVVHVLRPSGEVHVMVDGAFTVKGADRGRVGPPPGAGRKGGPRPGAPPAPQTPQRQGPPPGSGKTT